jgi:diguanylate cyclase (GGDEF)-like protein
MKKMSVHARLATTLSLLTLGIIMAGFFSLMILSKSMITSFQVEALTDPSIVIDELVNRTELLERGLSEIDLKGFEKSDLTKQGFLVKKLFENKIYQVEKGSVGAEFHIRSYDSSTLKWLKLASLPLAGILIFLGLISWFFTWSLGAVSLLPIKTLRKTTEDILAGKFEVSSRYQGRDEIGMTFNALRRLCIELDKKEEALFQVTKLATVDGLTGLKNNRSFKEELNKQLALAQRHGHSIGLAILDVDHFKKFNDTYGHQQGDEVLRVVGKTMQGAVRESDFVARYGGEEFVAIFPQTEGQGVIDAAEKIRKALESAKVNYQKKKGETLSVTASFGVVSIDGKLIPRGKKFEYTVFVEAADLNLYKAKKEGRNRVVGGLWDPTQVKEKSDQKSA